MKFKTDVKVTVLPDKQFKNRLAAMDEEIDEEAGYEELPLVITALKMVNRLKAPPADEEILEEGTFGEMGLVLLLSDTVPESFVVRSADGWGRDYYVAWRHGAQSCTRIDMVMDSAADRSEFVQAIGLWANYHGDATVRRAGNLVCLTACA